MNSLQGQWIGECTTNQSGLNDGLLVLNIDQFGEAFQAGGFLRPTNEDVPPTSFFTHGFSQKYKIEIEANLVPIDPRNERQIPRDSNYNDIWNFSEKANIQINATENGLKLWFQTLAGVKGSSHLKKQAGAEKSQFKAKGRSISWAEFQNKVTNLTWKEFAFRGQSSSDWKLRTSFHRTNRSDIGRYVNEVESFAMDLAGFSGSKYNLDNGIESAAYWHLLQHHGLPTPLLDWSYSPFTAAYFAFIDRYRKGDFSSCVRIHAFDVNAWSEDFVRAPFIDTTRLHISTLEPVPLGNRRAAAQMGLSTVTNVEDIEDYIRNSSFLSKRDYLQVFDIDASETEKAINSLRLMGITNKTLFPDIEGYCIDLKDHLFGSPP